MTLQERVQALADQLQHELGIEIESGSLCLHFGECRVQTVKHEGVFKLGKNALDTRPTVLHTMLNR